MAAVAETRNSRGLGVDTVIHSGFWGCGAFGGNRTLMVALQIVAAAASGVSHLVIHTGNESSIEDFRRGRTVADNFFERNSDSVSITSFLKHFEQMGFMWGTSDGN